MSCGLVILNYNDYDNTKRLVETILDYKCIDHIVVVDNCSTDNSYNKLKEIKSYKWDLIKTHSNLGYARGNNCGIKYLINKYNVDIIGISNSDVLFSSDLVDTILDDFRCSDYSLISGLQLTEDLKVFYHSFWNKITILGSYYNIMEKFYLFSRIIRLLNLYPHGKLVRESLKNDSIFPVDVIGGSLFFIKADVMKQINYFDGHTFLFFEEDILSCKLRSIHKKIGVDPRVSFVHYCSSSINDNIDDVKVNEIAFDSGRYYFKRYLTKNPLLILIYDLLVEIYWIEKRMALI